MVHSVQWQCQISTSLIILSNSLSPSLLLLLLLIGGATVGGWTGVFLAFRCNLARVGNEKSKSLSFFVLLLGPLLAAAGRFPLPLVPPRPLFMLLAVVPEVWSVRKTTVPETDCNLWFMHEWETKNPFPMWVYTGIPFCDNYLDRACMPCVSIRQSGVRYL